MNFRKIIIPRIPRLLALVCLGLTTLIVRWAVPKFNISPELATIIADYVAELVLGVALVGIGLLKLDDNKRMAQRIADERVKVAVAVQPRRKAKATVEDNRG